MKKQIFYSMLILMGIVCTVVFNQLTIEESVAQASELPERYEPGVCTQSNGNIGVNCSTPAIGGPCLASVSCGAPANDR